MTHYDGTRKADAALSLLLALLTACSNGLDVETLPAGSVPLQVTVTLPGTDTRSTGKENWEGGETIAVRIGTDTGNPTGRYVVQTDGSALPATAEQTLYWPGTAPMTVSAWWPYEETDIDLSDQTAGFAGYDFLRADTPDATYSAPVSLAFTHSMAKVSYTLVAGDGISADDLLAATVTLYGYRKAHWQEGVLTGSDPGYLTPTADGDLLMVPQEMEGTNFLRVQTGGIDYYYTPSAGEASLQAGKAYSYTITVRKSGLSVESVTAAWTDRPLASVSGPVSYRIYIDDQAAQAVAHATYAVCDAAGNPLTASPAGCYTLPAGTDRVSFTLTPEEGYETSDFYPAVAKGDATESSTRYDTDAGTLYISYTVRTDVEFDPLTAATTAATTSDVQLYDCLYADGTWGTGKHLPAVGIVFKLGAGSGDSAGLYGDLLRDGTIHGYAVSLRYAGTAIWGPSEDAGVSSNNLYDGYTNTQIILNRTDAHFYPAFVTASAYPYVCPSSGWYLPSSLQLGTVTGKSLNSLNNAITANRGEAISTSYTWSSTQYSSSIAFTNSWIRSKSSSYLIRPILTF